MATAREAPAQHREDQLDSAGIHPRKIHHDVRRKRPVRPIPHSITFHPRVAAAGVGVRVLIMPAPTSAVEALSDRWPTVCRTALAALRGNPSPRIPGRRLRRAPAGQPDPADRPKSALLPQPSTRAGLLEPG